MPGILVPRLFLVKTRGWNVVDVIINETLIEPGERYFIAYVDRPKGAGAQIVADLEMDLTGPVTAELMTPRKLSGFEFPALELIERARRTASENGVRKILLIDPKGFVPLSKVNPADRD